LLAVFSGIPKAHWLKHGDARKNGAQKKRRAQGAPFEQLRSRSGVTPGSASSVIHAREGGAAARVIWMTAICRCL
jgi:hypothetical protein